jgi:hypothetical protein
MRTGTANMFTTQCSKPMATKAMNGIQAARDLPVTERDTSPITVRSETFQLHSTPLTGAVAQPARSAAM